MTRISLVVTLGALASIAFPALSQPNPNPNSITVQVVNDSGIPDDKVFLLLGGKSVTAADGTSYAFSVSDIANVDMGAASPPATPGKPLKCRRTSISSASMKRRTRNCRAPCPSAFLT